MKSHRVAGSVLALVCAAITVSPDALAQAFGDRATARQLGRDGETALAAKNYKAAEDAFRRADRLVHAPTLLLGLARALMGEGKLLEAQEVYNTIIREGVPANAPPAFAKALEDAKGEVEAIGPKLGVVTIALGTSDGVAPDAIANLKVTIDDAPIGLASLGVRRPADPGSHVVQVQADGYKSASVTVSVTSGANADASLTLQATARGPVTPSAGTPNPTTTPPPLPTSPPEAGGSSTWRTVGWIVGGVGVVGLGLGTVFGVSAVSGKNNAHCNAASVCDPGSLGGVRSSATASTIGFVAGGVLLAGGVALVLWGPKGDAMPATTGMSLKVAPAVGARDLGIQLGATW
jgi:hypothetical protein